MHTLYKVSNVNLIIKNMFIPEDIYQLHTHRIEILNFEGIFVLFNFKVII